MWKRFKEWMGTDIAGAITNGAATPIWVYLSVSAGDTTLRIICAINVALFGFMAGSKLSDHFNRSLNAVRDVTIDRQHEMILQLLSERAELWSDLDAALAGRQDALDKSS